MCTTWAALNLAILPLRRWFEGGVTISVGRKKRQVFTSDRLRLDGKIASPTLSYRPHTAGVLQQPTRRISPRVVFWTAIWLYRK